VQQFRVAAACASQSSLTLHATWNRRLESRARCRREALRAVVERAVSANRLALIRAFCASMGPSTRHFRRPVQNFFSADTDRHLHIVKHCATRAKNLRSAQRRGNFATSEIAESHISSAFLSNARNHARDRVSEKFFRVALCQRAPCAPSAAARGGGYTQNVVDSLLFFSCCSNPVAVQIDSRLHFKISPSTQARRAAMAKRRKKAAKKTAKKTKRRKKK